MKTMRSDHIVLGLIVLGLIVWIYTNNTKDGFSAFYYGPRRTPDDFKRTPFVLPNQIV